MNESLPLQAWLQRLELLHPVEIELGTARVAAVAERMGLIDHAHRADVTVVTVAGTNGKGSCIAALQAFGLAQGLQVGTFTSPHFIHYCERIRINGEKAMDADVCAAFAAIEAARGDISLTYFEFGTLAALEVFRRHGLNLWLLEVGLGGRMDAVNIIDADIAVVTSIALDHEAWLGSDRDSIGREKAGIYRSARPAICADLEAPAALTAYARDLGADLQCAGREWGWQLHPATATTAETWSWWRNLDRAASPAAHQTKQITQLPMPVLPLPSVAAALLVADLLGWSCDFPCLIPGLELAGRAQLHHVGGTQVMLDVAHNPAAAALMAERLAKHPVRGKTLAVFAVMADKDAGGIFDALVPAIDGWYLGDLVNTPRAAKAATIAAQLQARAATHCVAPSIDEALARAIQDAGDQDRILVVGSFFTVAAAMHYLQLSC